tara:strand:+ start:344 stop:472 length:129 start_codon:yes stop_codon:yes gene_type:complete
MGPSQLEKGLNVSNSEISTKAIGSFDDCRSDDIGLCLRAGRG